MISIITPHWNDLQGIEDLFDCFKNQDSKQWEWIIVDDASDGEIQKKLKDFEQKTNSFNIKVFLNEEKKNASFCRNLGAQKAQYDKLIFLDSDDFITPKFVSNRLIEVDEFVVYQNIIVVNYENENQTPYSLIKEDFLNNFLRAKFAWQTTSVLWNKDFFFQIGGFDDNLKLLQDVEISIRMLFLGKKYRILTDNQVDFYYRVKKIDIEKRTLLKVSESVNYLIEKLNSHFKLTRNQQKMLSSYYYLVTRYFIKSNKSDDYKKLNETLKINLKNKSINLFNYFFGKILIWGYQLKLLNSKSFLKLNRKAFKE